MVNVNLNDYVRGGTLKVLARPGKKKDSIVGLDPERKAVIIELKAVAQDNKANIRLIKFLTRELKREVRIKSGLTSKEKVLSVH
jgi:uncharacterized protein (TIGR00251 family)